MTSGKSFSVNGTGSGLPVSGQRQSSFFTRQRELFRRRLWPAALTVLGCLLYNVICTVTVLLVEIQNASFTNMTPAENKAALVKVLDELLGVGSFGAPFLAAVLAAVLGIEGFAWMSRRAEVDFYESQPVSRRRRFLDICVSGFLYFVISDAVTLAVGLLLAGALGALTRAVLLSIFLQGLRTAALFLAVYGLSVLSAMLTGNVIVAELAFFVLLFYEAVLKRVLEAYCSVFFATWADRPSGLLTAVLSSPLYHYRYSSVPGGILRLLVLAALYFLLAWVCCSLRRNECAGTAVVFGPVRTVVRIAVSALTGLAVGLLLSAGWNLAPVAILWMVLFTVIAACIMQIIYEYDFRALFRHPLEIAAAVAIGLVVYAVFLFDLPGYDRYVPDPAQVSDAALICREDGYTSAKFDDHGTNLDDVGYGETYMHLDNVEDVTAIAEYCQDFTRKKKALRGADGEISVETGGDAAAGGQADVYTNPYDVPTSSVTVLYRMKNGKTVARAFELPSTMDPARMNAVIGTQAYREGAFNIYHDEAMRVIADKCTLSCYNGLDYTDLRLDTGKYEAFRAAYLSDLAQYDYSLAHGSYPAFKLYIEADHSSLEISMECPVYASFANTLAFLQENGLRMEPVDYETLAQHRAQESLSAEEQAILEEFDEWGLRGAFSPYY